MAPPLPLRALQAFEAFGRLGSVTAAAAELGVSLGAVSQHLRKAEDAAGVRLVERAGRTVRLTTRGRKYLAGLTIGFDALREAQDKVRLAENDNVLTLSCLPSLAVKWVASRLFDWQMRYPGTTVRLIGENPEPRLGPDLADFRLSYGRMAKDYDHLTELFTDWVVPACSPSFLAAHPVRRPADILDQSLMVVDWSRDQGMAPTWTQWAASQGLPARDLSGQISFSLSSAAIDAAVNGRGFVLAQLSMATDDIAAGRLVVPFDARMRLDESYFLAWDRAVLDKPMGPALRSWLIALGKQQESRSARLGTPPG